MENYSVWVGGVEVNDYYLTKVQAENLALEYKDNNYNDVIIVKKLNNYEISN